MSVKVMVEMQTEITKLRTEKERLRSRLRDILYCGSVTPACRRCRKKNEFARAALKGE